MLLWWFCLLSLALADRMDGFSAVPAVNNHAEYYDRGDVSYAIFLERVTHNEAKMYCYSRNGTLLELRRPGVGEFIGRALSESAVGFSAVWIGGEFEIGWKNTRNEQEPGHWKWSSGESIMVPDKKTTFPMKDIPYWLDRPNLTISYDQCLIMDRDKLDNPVTTGLSCNQKRPFICELGIGAKNLGVPKEEQPCINVAGKVYHLFEAWLTWLEAFNYCKSLHLNMATVKSQLVINKLYDRMQRARPVIENAWLGGYFKDGKWTWVTSKENVSVKVQTTPVYTADEMFVFPPSYCPDILPMDGCLLADRHLSDNFVLVAANCERRRSVVCEESSEQLSSEVLVKVNMTDTYISTIALPWEDAQEQCRRCLGNDWTLLQLTLTDAAILREQMIHVYRAMTHYTRKEIRHLWLNGLMHNGTFYWSNSRKKILESGSRDKMALDKQLFGNHSKALLTNKGDDGFVFFSQDEDARDIPFLRRHQCLNMDREFQKHYFLYGLNCRYKQHFICAHGSSKSGVNKDCIQNSFDK